MKISHIIFLIILLCGKVFAGDTNFVAEVNTIWQTRNASNIVAYVDGYLTTNRNAEALFARGVLAAALEVWGCGAANYLVQAIDEISTDSSLSAEQKTFLSKKVDAYRDLFEALTEDVSEPINSVATWDDGIQSEIFNEIGDEFPFLSELEMVANPP